LPKLNGCQVDLPNCWSCSAFFCECLCELENLFSNRRNVKDHPIHHRSHFLHQKKYQERIMRPPLPGMCALALH
jgi:hypothetical protein